MTIIFDKIDSAYFNKGNVSQHTGDYTNSETNINLNVPTVVEGSTELNGNINSVYALKSSGDIHICGNVMNANNSVICSEDGSIIIESDNVNMTGLLYAPLGSIRIKSQSLNHNSTIIIAQEIVIDCSNVNINYNNDMGKLIGTPSDSAGTLPDRPEHKEDADTPSDGEEHTEDENGNGLPDYYEDYDNWAELADSDGDGFPDVIEDFIKTDRNLADSDGDGLDDFYEVFVTYTDPTLVDSDNNGVSDADEDFDKDGLTNIQERDRETDPYNDDTDEDGLKDGDEVNTYKTDPLKNDTDDDRLEDGDEIFFGTAPLNPDTDGNGILDGDEKRPQTFVYENGDSVIENVSISMEATGNLQKTSDIDNIMDKDILCSEVVGLVGEPFSIETDSKFDKALITFKVDKSKLDDTEFADLLFLWYDEENYEFVELETICDEENSTVSVETTHFSKYMIVDRYKWFEAWNTELNYESDILGISDKTAYKTVLTVSCSDTMKDNDPITSYEFMDGPDSIVYRKTCKRIRIVDSFINKMNETDKVSMVSVNSFGGFLSNYNATKKDKDLQDAIKEMHEYGFTDYGSASFVTAISRSMRAFGTLYKEEGKYEKRIILVSDGNFSMPSSRDFHWYLDWVKTNEIKIYTFGVGTYVNEELLEYISDYTNGKYYRISTLDELEDIYEEIGFGSNFDTTDTDGDGFYDVVETAGIRILNGTIIRGCDPRKKDTDGDGLSDGEEILPTLHHYTKEIRDKETNEILYAKGYSFKMKSNPTKADTDGDGLLDGRAVYDKYEYGDTVRNIAIAPKDPDPMEKSEYANIWLSRIHEIQVREKTAYHYSDEYYKPQKIKVNWKENDINFYEVVMSYLSSIGSETLDFRYDDQKLALHSDTTQWQKKFGYNDFYDKVFKTFTKMDKGKYKFVYNGTNYVLWAWKGDYLNLGPGAELGFYYQNKLLEDAKEDLGAEHWIVGDTLPMTLSLYQRANENASFFSRYHWFPDEDQWWITGFVPDEYHYKKISENDLIHVSSVDFKDREGMFEALRSTYEGTEKGKKLIFDVGDKKVWIIF